MQRCILALSSYRSLLSPRSSSPSGAFKQLEDPSSWRRGNDFRVDEGARRRGDEIQHIEKHPKFGSEVVCTYALLDPGSSATFCTEALMNKLKLSGQKTVMLLRAMNEEKPVSAYVISGLEMSNLSGEEFIDLLDVFTHKTIPVGKENIPQQKDLERWPHLKEIHLPHIEADIGLLIGANVPKAMEPWEVVSSVGNGPYAVRTKLGWTVNGPLRESCSWTDKRKPTKALANRISVASLESL